MVLRFSSPLSCRRLASVEAAAHSRIIVRASSWEKVCTRKELDEGGGRLRAKVGSTKLLVQEHEGTVFCVSNVCTHLKLPLVGRTAFLQGEVFESHNPNKMQSSQQPIMVLCVPGICCFSVQADDLSWEPCVNQVKDGCIECPAHKTMFNLETGQVEGDWAPTFPEVPFIGKGEPTPLPTFEVKEENGDVLVLI